MSLFNVQTRIVDTDGRPTREMVRVLSDLTRASDTGLAGRVTALEGSVASLSPRMTTAEGNITTLQAASASQAARIADLEVLGLFVTPWP